jgi:hypothetical protein
MGTNFEGFPPVDRYGNPMVRVGCPNCGKGERMMSGIEYAAACNSGRDPTGPCSRRCVLQLEYAEELKDRRARKEEFHAD